RLDDGDPDCVDGVVSGGNGCAGSAPCSASSASVGGPPGFVGPLDCDPESSVSATAAMSFMLCTLAVAAACTSCVGCARSLASPKSSTLMRPSRVRMRLSLLM